MMPKNRAGIWISNLDGSHLKLIGEMPIEKSDLQNASSEIQNLQWLPSGKKVSYIYHGALYTVPVD